MRLGTLFKSLSLSLEYVSFLLCSIYWFCYSLARVKGIPVLFNGIEIDSTFSGIVVCIILFFNSVFYARLLIELIAKVRNLRTRVVSYLSNNLILVFSFLFAVTFITGGRFDYASYKLQWETIFSGGNPWGFIEGGMVNAYGYTFNALAPLYAVHSILPKFLFVLLLVLFCLQLRAASSSENRALALFLCVNPFTISSLAIYGFIDGMCSILLGFSLLYYCIKPIKSSYLSGALLSLSFLTKFYTLAALPIFIFSKPKKVRSVGFLTGFLCAAIFVISISYVLWGGSILTPLLFAQARDPSFLTPWKYMAHPDLRTIVFGLFSVLAITSACLRQKLSCSLRSAAVLSIIFGTYYLGHQQFYLGILICLTVYIIESCGSSSSHLKSSLSISFALIFGWLIFIQTGFELFDEFKPLGLENILPYLSFINFALLVSSGVYWLMVKNFVPAERRLM